jgi:hypothetical protein
VSDLETPPRTTPVRQAPPPPTRKHARRAAFAVIAPPAILALALVANGVKNASNRTASATEQAQRDLANALAKVPFTVHLPERLSSGAQLVRVVLAEPDSKQGPDIYSLDAHYNVPRTGDDGSSAAEVWQSNDTFLSAKLKDPLHDPGEPVQVAGTTWYRVKAVGVTTSLEAAFGHRYDDGITAVVVARSDTVAKDVITRLVTFETKRVIK